MNFDFSKTKQDLNNIFEYLKQEYLQISTGRANPTLLDGVYVESYGTKQPVKNIASINLEDARTLRIVPWDKNQIQDIEKAIHDSQLPFSVSVDDAGVRLNIPQLTQESKQSLVKLIKQKLEDARVKVRNVRHETNRAIEDAEKAGDFAEDARKRFKEELQKIVDEANKNLEELYDKKENDINKV
jgi:ribosome recycling factor